MLRRRRPVYTNARREAPVGLGYSFGRKAHSDWKSNAPALEATIVGGSERHESGFLHQNSAEINALRRVL